VEGGERTGKGRSWLEDRSRDRWDDRSGSQLPGEGYEIRGRGEGRDLSQKGEQGNEARIGGKQKGESEEVLYISTHTEAPAIWKIHLIQEGPCQRGREVPRTASNQKGQRKTEPVEDLQR